MLENELRKIETLLEKGKFREGLDLSENILIGQLLVSLSDKDKTQLLNYAGVFSIMLGDVNKAQPYFEKILQISPNNIDAYNRLAVIFMRQKNFKKAQEFYEKILQLNPNNIQAHNTLGNLFKRQKKLTKSQEHFEKSLIINPNNAQAYYNLGCLSQSKKELKEAQRYYEKAIELKIDYFPAYNNLGVLLEEKKDLIIAQKYYEKALSLNPNYIDAHYNLAALLKKKKHFLGAQKCYEKILSINPTHISTYCNLGLLLQEQKKMIAAQKCYRTALRLNPNHINAQWNLSLLLLLIGDFKQGWKYYEIRYAPGNSKRISNPPKIQTPQYQGESLIGKTLLIYPEQGFGDEIQFSRYLSLLKTKKGVKKIVLVCKSPLKALFSNLDCVDQVLSRNEFEESSIKNLDYWIFIMSLPLYFETRLETIPNIIPYLFSPKQDQARWQGQLPKNVFNIGLIWKGQPNFKNDTERSLSSLSQLKPFWDIDNVNFISLQKGAGEDEALCPPADQPLTHLGNKITNFADTAAIVSQLDLVICSDTAIAHLAGSLGVKTYVMLSYSADWRWYPEQDESPWYPGMQLFRQKSRGDWAGVIQQIVKHLHLRRYF